MLLPVSSSQNCLKILEQFYIYSMFLAAKRILYYKFVAICLRLTTNLHALSIYTSTLLSVNLRSCKCMIWQWKNL